MATLGDLVRKRRRELGMTQAELAGKVGITGSYIAKIEVGYQKCSFEVLDKLAVILSIPLADALAYSIPSPKAWRISEAIRDYDRHFHQFSPAVKNFLLEIAPIVEKYV